MTTVRAMMLLAQDNLSNLQDICAELQHPDFELEAQVLVKGIPILRTEFGVADRAAMMVIVLELQKFWQAKETYFTNLYYKKLGVQLAIRKGE